MATESARGPLGEAREYLDLVKFSHTLFALPFALLGAALAAHGPEGWMGRPRDWLGILLCMASARTAAMAFNRLVDRRIDALNPRTASRHLPRGRLASGPVAAFTAVASLGFVASTLLFMPNVWPIALSIPVLLWLLGYSFAKRFTSLAHVWLGLALAFAPVCAWVAFRGSIGWPPILLGLAVMTWVTGFDVIYACQDEAFDRSHGLHSIPGRMGTRGALRFAAACHAATVLTLVGLGLVYPFGTIWFVGVAVVAVLLFYEHAIVRPDDLSRVNVAFFQVNVAISLGLLAVGVADLILSGRPDGS
jgi:4-hydroxybenzoate polyprenyltransferase